VSRLRAGALLALLAGGLLTACASGSTSISDPPLCRSGDEGGAGNGVILMAQSVPTASWVPCLRTALPLGWRFNRLDARNGGSQFWLDSDRDGTEAIQVRLERSCATAGSTEIASDREGMRRMERVFQVSPTFSGERYYLFGGGCLTFVFHLASGSPGEALALASQAVGVVSRADLRAQVHQRSGGRLELDPSAEGTALP
jgi:hypothetical protein